MKGNLHPADEKALSDVWADVCEEFAKVPPGGTMTVRISREKLSGRVSPDGTHIERRTYPLQE